MGDKTGIEWTDATWNPIAGCARVSPGCDNCYALKLHNRRYKANVRAAVAAGHRSGAGKTTIVERARFLFDKLPLPAQYDLPFTRVQLLPDRLDLPLRWRRPRRIFVNSMSDLFHDDVPDEFIDRVFGVMALAQWHTFQLLTKRPERMRSYLTELTWERLRQRMNENVYGAQHGPGAYSLTSMAVRTLKVAFRELYRDDPGRVAVLIRRRDTTLPLPNVWLGVSVENQHWADERIPLLLETPAAVRFISAEPLLDGIDLTRLPSHYEGADRPLLRLHALSGGHWCGPGQFGPDTANLDWVIAGGESGGPPERRLVQECCCKGSPFPPPQRDHETTYDAGNTLCDAYNAGECSLTDWRPTADGLARVRSLRDQCVAAGVPFLFKQWGGPRPASGGRLLDGRTWDEYPDVRPARAPAPANQEARAR